MKNEKKTRLFALGRPITTPAAALIVLVWATVTSGQRGMGDSKGIADQRQEPHLAPISGILAEIKTHPCDNTTGPTELGTHLILRDEHGKELNIHLGPAPVLLEVVKRLKVGENLALLGFHTDRMPPSHYAATKLILADCIVYLRDSDFRPYWSQSRLGYQVQRPSTAITSEPRTAARLGCLQYSPSFWQHRCLRGLRRSGPGRRRCGRMACRRWQCDNWDH